MLATYFRIAIVLTESGNRMNMRSFGRSRAIVLGLGIALTSLTGCAPNDAEINRYSDLIELVGFEQATYDEEEGNAVIFYYDAVVRCDAYGELPVRFRINTDHDEPIREITIFKEDYTQLPVDKKHVKDVTVDDLRRQASELQINNCLSENT